MIYKDLNTLFIHVPKNAGTSISKLLRNNSPTHTKDKFAMQKTTSIDQAKIYHRTAHSYLDSGDLTKIEYESLFKFGVVREPFQRAVSMYKYMLQSKRIDCSPESFFYDWLPNTLTKPDSKYLYFCLPQHLFLLHENKTIVDKIVYFENFKEDMTFVLDFLGIKDEVPFLNATNKEGNKNILENMEFKKVIQELYAEDYKYFYTK